MSCCGKISLRNRWKEEESITMSVVMRVEVHFHEQKEASVFLESNVTDHEEQQWSETIFFSYFIAGQISTLISDANMGSSFANFLSKFELPQAPVDDDFKNYIAFLLNTDPNNAKLVDDKGTAGRKIFDAELKTGPPLDFTVNIKGFGLPSTDISYYAMNSVLLLWQYLGRRRMQNKDYLYTLAKVAQYCGKLYLNGKMTIKFQADLSVAFKIVELAYADTELFFPH